MKKLITFLICLSLVLSFCPLALTANEDAPDEVSVTEYDESGAFDMEIIDNPRPALSDPVEDEPDLYGNANYSTETAAQLRGERVLNELLVKFKEPWQVPGKEKQLQHEIEKLKKVGFVEGLGVYVVKMDDLEKNPNAVLNQLKNNKYIDYVEPNYIVETESEEPTNAGYTRNLASIARQIKAPAGWDLVGPDSRFKYQYSNVVIAVVDSGMFLHTDIRDNMLAGYSATAGLNPNNDVISHGTSVGGVLGADGRKGNGVAGINWGARIQPVRADDGSGTLTIANIAKGIMWAADNGARIINMSFGTVSDVVTLKSAIDYAYGRGCVLVAATGNSAATTLPYPARYSNVLAVGASNNGTTRNPTSSYGQGIDVVAFGGYYTTITGGTYASVAGTSFAAPQVAGLASLIWSVNKNLTNAEIYNLIRKGAKGNGNYINNELGYGQIDIEKTLQLAEATLPNKKDTVPPVLTLTGGSLVQVKEGSAYVEPGYKAIDDVDGDITHKVTVTGTANVNVPGSYTLTYRVSDAAGNAATATRTIEVVQVDRTPPVITLLGSQYMQIKQGERYVEPGYTAFDAVDGVLTSKVTVTGTVNSNQPGAYTLTYRASDAAGNAAAATRTVEVIYVDRTPPELSLIGSQSMQIMQGEDYIEMGCVAIDNIDGDISDQVEITGDVNANEPGRYTVTYTVSDAAGNVATATRTVEVLEAVEEPESEPGDTHDPGEIPLSPLTPTPTPAPLPTPTPAPQPLPPTITLLGFGEMTLFEGDTYHEDGYRAADFLGNDITGHVQVSTNITDNNKWTPGLYWVKYTVTDSFGGTASMTRIVIVEPAPPPPPPQVPTITANGSAVIVLHQNVHQYVEQNARAIDFDGENISSRVVRSGTAPDFTKAGTYTLTYTVTGKSGERATAVRTVRVVAPTTVSATRRAYSFSGQAKAGTKVTHTNVAADANGFFDLRVSSIDKNMTIYVELVNTATKQVAAKDTFSAAGMKQYSIGSGKYDLTVTVTQANGNSKYTVDLTMPEVKQQSFGVIAVPLDELPDLPDATDGDAAAPGTVTYTVAAGDSLWKISQKHYGTGLRWFEIYSMNKQVIGPNPSSIKVGQILTIKT